MKIGGVSTDLATAARTAPAKLDARARLDLDTRELATRTALLKLQARDREVRQHEQAHVIASGGLARSGPSYTYMTGPDGKRYAIGGSVSIDTTPGKTPEETIDRAARIRAAALAPAQPSGQDLAVAAQADQMAREARAELEAKRDEEAKGVDEPRAARVESAAARAYGTDTPAPRKVSQYL